MFKSAIFKRSLVRSYSSAIATEIKSRGPWHYLSEPISSNNVEKLDASFSEYIPSYQGSRQEGQQVPPGFHLIFFNNVSPESNLSSDGYHKSQAPDDSKFPARMWLGGKLEFNPEADQLTVGSLGSAKEIISGTRYKSTQVGFATVERLDVTMERFLYGSGLTRTQLDQATDTQWAVKETRSLAYFSPEASANRESTFNRFLQR